MTKKLALIFDFCGTLTTFQTLDAFSLYVREQKGSSFHPPRLLWKAIPRSFRVAITCRVFKGMSQQELETYGKKFYRERVKPHFDPAMLELLVSAHKQKITTVVVSAALDVYLSHFQREFKVDQLLCSQLEMKKGKATGVLKVDMYGQEKVKALRKTKLLTKQLTISFTDHISDKPLLQATDLGLLKIK